MATSNAAPPGFDPSTTSPNRALPGDAPRFIDHLAAWRPSAAHDAASQVRNLFTFARQNLLGLYLASAILPIIAQILNILALAGTIKIAAMILFRWEQAIKIAAALGISLEGATRSDIAWIGSGVILTIYAMAGIAGFISRRTQVAMTGRAERILYERYLHHPALDTLLKSERLRNAVPRAITIYSKSCLSLALVPGLAALSALLALILALFQPLFIVGLLIALLPLLVLYLLAGRRASAADAILKAAQTERKLLFRTLRASRSPEARETTSAQILALTDKMAILQRKVKAISSIPEASLAFAAGLALATAMIILTSAPTNPDHLIYLLIGFIMIRFMFVYLKGVFGQIQKIVQNLDEIRFMHRTILSETISEEAIPPPSQNDESGDDLDEILD